MPIYDYLCTACDHRADILHGINDPGPHFCPSCGAEGAMRKQFTTPAIHFKGSGWAKKDRGSSVATRAAAAASGPDGGKDAKGADASSSGSDAGSGGESVSPKGSGTSEPKDPGVTGPKSSGSSDTKGTSSSRSSSDKGD